MNIYLAPELQTHRRGRFLASLLGISMLSEREFPSEGVVLITGEQWQESPDLQTEYITWARQPGRSLIMLPPYKKGCFSPSLDWMIELTSSHLANNNEESLEHILAGEISYQLLGRDGDCITDASLGELACHTRYWKAHSNSGLIAATTLPLWSISLLDHVEKVRSYLTKLQQFCGKPSATNTKEEAEEKPIHPQDVTVLVCCYGFNLTTADDLSNKLATYTVPLLNLASFDLSESICRLRKADFLNDDGLTETGLIFLKTSQYWSFAENIKGVI